MAGAQLAAPPLGRRNCVEQEQETVLVVGIRFQRGGKIYAFSASDETDIVAGDFAVVNTAWGRQVGQVVYTREVRADEQRNDLKPILCRATGADLALRQHWEEKAQQALERARDLAKSRSLPVKFAAAEYTHDGKRLTNLYESEAKESLQGIQKSLSRSLRVRVELRQVGPRDRAKLLDGYGTCGEPRCCSRFLSTFTPVSIRMAKAQGVSLTPSEITGMCGRLRCCLTYEYKMYAEASKNLPKRRARVSTPYGTGRVVDLLPLKDVVVVQVQDRRIELSAEDVELLPAGQPQPKRRDK